MATLMLSGLGSAVGGEFGALIGAMAGRSIDASLFGGQRGRPKEDLSVQTARYGREIPKIFGTMRVGGAVVWATDLQAGASSISKYGSSGIGYWANFAVALSSRRARQVRRIWADGNLLRGAEGDFKVPVTFRFYRGDEDQAVDPLISSLEGVASVPAFRGLALAVFENLDLSTFGNRIPFLTFEIEADEGEVEVADILSEVSGSHSRQGELGSVHGFAAVGEDVASAIGDLATAYGVPDFGWVADAGRPPKVFQISEEELGCSVDESVPTDDLSRRAMSDMPNSVRCAFLDRDLDLQASEQKVFWSTGAGSSLLFDLPIALSASAAKTLGHDVLARQWRRRETRTVRLPQEYAELKPGDELSIEKRGSWIVSQVRIERLTIICVCHKASSAMPTALASSGRAILASDVKALPSEVFLLDLPLLQGEVGRSRMFLAGRTNSESWRRLSAGVSATGADIEQTIIERRVVAGRVADPLPGGSTELIDRRGSFLVTLSDDDWLESCTDEELARGKNLALLGDEILQFADARPLGNRTFEVGRLLRGRFGSEWACSEHVAGERFLLLGADTLKSVEIPLTFLNCEIRAQGRSLGDNPAGSQAMAIYRAESLRPPSPVHLTGNVDENGVVRVNWTRRSRLGFQWLDYAEAPLAEEQEAYRITLSSAAQTIERVVHEPRCSIDGNALAVSAGETLTIEVVQLGSAMPSRPATLQMRM